MSVGFPATLKLHEFGSQVIEAFGGHMPFHVGSSLKEKRGWRDVDVRLILPDDEYAAMGLGDPKQQQQNGKWVALCRAFSALGQEMTGLPIDFQIQQMTAANSEFCNRAKDPRSALGIVPLRVGEP